MTLPSNLLQAVASPGGGRISLVVGAGCSVDPPTSIPPSRDCSIEIHRCLVAAGELEEGECHNPEDLSSVADTVYAKKESQRLVVEEFRERYGLKHATPNDGHRIAVAMLCEGTISSIATLNFDLALSAAISELGVGRTIGVIEGPEDIGSQKLLNLYYLHRNANTDDLESWVLRSPVLEEQWKGHWEAIIATRVLATPVVAFVGLGTPVAVLIESVRLLRSALPEGRVLYQVDVMDRTGSSFFAALALTPSSYVQMGWCDFMEELSGHWLGEHINRLQQAIGEQVRDGVPDENVTNLLTRLRELGLIAVGRIRSHWLLHDKPYCPVDPQVPGLMGDLLLGIALVARVSRAVPIILEEGLIEFYQDGRVIATLLAASGAGHRSTAAVEARVGFAYRKYRNRQAAPRAIIVGGTSDGWTTSLSPPRDIVEGDSLGSGDIVRGPTAGFKLFHVGQLRANPTQIDQVLA